VIPAFNSKKGIRLCHYDVTQLSNLRSQRALNEMPLPLLDRLVKRKRQSLANTERGSPTNRLERSLKLMSERKGPEQTGVLVRAVEELGRK
jgi:hypothetical protein